MNTSESADRGEVVVSEAPDGEIRVDVRLEEDTVWLTQQQMAEPGSLLVEFDGPPRRDDGALWITIDQDAITIDFGMFHDHFA